MPGVKPFAPNTRRDDRAVSVPCASRGRRAGCKTTHGLRNDDTWFAQKAKPALGRHKLASQHGLKRRLKGHFGPARWGSRLIAYQLRMASSPLGLRLLAASRPMP